MIYTGRFSKINKYLASGYEIIGITRFPPNELKRYSIKNIDFLAPASELLLAYKNGNMTKDQFVDKYNDFLNNNEDMIHEMINWMLDSNKDIVLCCYEKSSEFCHRHILADFVNSKGWTYVKEV